MKHLRRDYDAIQDPTGKIGVDEPTFILRAKDVLMPSTLRHWADALELAASTTSTAGGQTVVQGHAWPDVGVNYLAERVRNFAKEVEAWQREFGCKVPDTPNGALRNSIYEA